MCFFPPFRVGHDIESVIILKGSEDYSFIHVEDYGYVTSYNPRMSKGKLHWKALGYVSTCPVFNPYIIFTVVLLFNFQIFDIIRITRTPALLVFLAPPEGLTKFLSSLYHA